MASISYNGSPATADYATEKKSAKLENEIESADTAEQRSDVAPTYQVKSSYIQGIGTKKVLWKKSYENVYCKLLKEKNSWIFIQKLEISMTLFLITFF